MVDLPGRPATDLRAAMEENLEQAHDARLMDFEAGRADTAIQRVVDLVAAA